jgi:hypothetical protein
MAKFLCNLKDHKSLAEHNDRLDDLKKEIAEKMRFLKKAADKANERYVKEAEEIWKKIRAEVRTMKKLSKKEWDAHTCVIHENGDLIMHTDEEMFVKKMVDCVPKDLLDRLMK